MKYTLQQQMNRNKASVSWARKSWSTRFNEWLQADDHVPEMVSKGSPTPSRNDITYCFGRRSRVVPRTLSMSDGTYATPQADTVLAAHRQLYLKAVGGMRKRLGAAKRHRAFLAYMKWWNASNIEDER